MVQTRSKSRQLEIKEITEKGVSSVSLAKPKRKAADKDIETTLEWIIGYSVAAVSIVAHAYFLLYLWNEYDRVENKVDGKIRDYVSLWVPIFLISIFFEMIWGFTRSKKWHRTSDNVSSLATGSLMELSRKLHSQLISFVPYVYIYQNFAVTHSFEKGALSWWLMFIGVEFGYYWVHRTGHTINAFWAMHGVHHSSEEYNLCTALRQSTIHGFVSWLYYLPLAFFFPPALFIIHAQYNLLYQFWIHTRSIPTLGPLEWVLNTPSQHRVHHGRNEYCIDKNYGGTLCIFDRLFGTFQEEIPSIPVCYGLTHSLNTFNPIEANVSHWRNIWAGMKTVPTITEKFLVLYNGPGRIPGTQNDYPIPPITVKTAQKYNPRLSLHLQTYITVHVLLIIVIQQITSSLLSSSKGFTYAFHLVTCAFIVLSFYSMGNLCNRGKLAGLVETFRLFFLGALSIVAIGIYQNSDSIDHDWDTVLSLKKLLSAEFLSIAVFIVASLFYLFWDRNEFDVPLQDDEIGKDSPLAKRAQQLQTRGLKLRTKKNVLDQFTSSYVIEHNA